MSKTNNNIKMNTPEDPLNPRRRDDIAAKGCEHLTAEQIAISQAAANKLCRLSIGAKTCEYETIVNGAILAALAQVQAELEKASQSIPDRFKVEADTLPEQIKLMTDSIGASVWSIQFLEAECRNYQSNLKSLTAERDALKAENADLNGELELKRVALSTANRDAKELTTLKAKLEKIESAMAGYKSNPFSSDEAVIAASIITSILKGEK